jgi:hypothetical protein
MLGSTMTESHRAAPPSGPGSPFAPGPFSSWGMFTRYLASVVAVCAAVIAAAGVFDGPRDTRLIAAGVLLLACHVLMTAARR